MSTSPEPTKSHLALAPSVSTFLAPSTSQPEEILSDEEQRKRRELLARRPSYRKILSDLSDLESTVKKELSDNQLNHLPNGLNNGDTSRMVTATSNSNSNNNSNDLLNSNGNGNLLANGLDAQNNQLLLTTARNKISTSINNSLQNKINNSNSNGLLQTPVSSTGGLPADLLMNSAQTAAQQQLLLSVSSSSSANNNNNGTNLSNLGALTTASSSLLGGAEPTMVMTAAQALGVSDLGNYHTNNTQHMHSMVNGADSLQQALAFGQMNNEAQNMLMQQMNQASDLRGLLPLGVDANSMHNSTVPGSSPGGSFVSAGGGDYSNVLGSYSDSDPSPNPSSSSRGEHTNEGGTAGGDQQGRKRQLRLLKNREAAKECRRKKKEYVKCLESRVAVLENQNKALIDELKTLKELYCRKEKGEN